MPLTLLPTLLAGVVAAAEPDPPIDAPADAQISGSVVVVPALGTPAAAARRRVSTSIVWDGGPADVRITSADGTTRVALGATSPLDVGRLERDEVVTVQRDDVALGEVDATLVWTPADVAAWSGPGLRGARVTAIAATSSSLWVATDGGGLALWDGATFQHLGRRQGLPDRVVDVSLADGIRWIADVDGVTRLAADGTASRWRVGEALAGAVRSVLGTGERTALVTSDVGVTAIGVGDDGAPSARGLVEDRGCAGLVGPADAPIAACAHAWRTLDSACAIDPASTCVTPTHDAALPPRLRAIVPANGGRWLAVDDGLAFELNGDVQRAWSVPSGHVLDATELGAGLLVAAGDGGAWHVAPPRAVLLPRAVGLPSEVALAVAPGPMPGKAWLGTDRGVALVSQADTATPLPLAPLAAGIGVRAVAGKSDPVLAASDDGLAWIGRPPSGGDDLRAAVTGPVVDVARVGRDWWVLGDRHAWRLDRKGHLDRWDLDGEAVGLAVAGAEVVLATADGLRTWLPGATLLGPLDPMPAVRAIAAGTDGALWVLVEGEVRRLDRRRGPEVWSVPGARELVTAGPGAIVATAHGLVWLTAGHPDPVVPDVPSATVPTRDLAVRDGHLWTLTDDGTVTKDGRPLAVVRAPRRLHVDAAGAWVATGEGLWRVVP